MFSFWLKIVLRDFVRLFGLIVYFCCTYCSTDEWQFSKRLSECVQSILHINTIINILWCSKCIVSSLSQSRNTEFTFSSTTILVWQIIIKYCCISVKQKVWLLIRVGIWSLVTKFESSWCPFTYFMRGEAPAHLAVQMDKTYTGQRKLISGCFLSDQIVCCGPICLSKKSHK